MPVAARVDLAFACSRCGCMKDEAGSFSEISGDAIPRCAALAWCVAPASRTRRAVITGILVVAACSVPAGVVAARHVLLNSFNKVEDWLPPSMAEIQEWFWFVSHFKGDEVLVVTWPGCGLGESSLDVLADRARAVNDTSGRPVFRRVVSGRELFKQLTSPPLSLSPETARQRLSGWILGPDRESTCVILMVDTSRTPDRRHAVAEIKKIATQDCGIPPDALRIGGPTADSVFIDNTSASSLTVLSLVSILLGILLAAVFLRNAVAVVATFSTALLAEAYIILIIYLSGATMDAVMTMVPLLVYVLTICASMHFMNCYQTELGTSPRPLMATIAHVWQPTTWAVVTTAAGLASLTVSDLVPIQRFGLFGALGVLVSLPVMFGYQPAFLALWAGRTRGSSVRADCGISLPQQDGMAIDPGDPRRFLRSIQWQKVEDDFCHGPRDASGQTAPVTPLVRGALRVSEMAMERSTLVLVVAVIAAIALGRGAMRLTTSAKIRDMFRPESRELEDYRWIERNVAPLVPIDVVLCFPRDGESTLYEHAVCVEEVCDRLANVPLISGINSPVTFLPDLKPGGSVRGVMRRVVMNAKLKAERGRLVEGGMIADTPTEELWLISGRVPVFSAVEYEQLLAEVRGHVDEEIRRQSQDQGRPFRAVVCGGVPVIATVQKQLLSDLQSSLGASLLLIGGFLAVGLRSIRAAAVLLIPNVLPVLFLFGLMGWLGITVDLGSMLTISTALGIAVDNELHFIDHFRRLCRAGLSREEAVRGTLRHSTAPIIQSAFISGAGMLVLTLSPFLPTVRFGGLMFLLLAAACLGDLLLLPAILKSPMGRVFVSKTG